MFTYKEKRFTAGRMRKTAIDHVKRNYPYYKTYDWIAKRLEKRANKGKFTLTVNGNITKSDQELLRKDGYTVIEIREATYYVIVC